MEQMSREQWLQERRKGIGGSDIAAIMGYSPWRTPLQVYLDKTQGADMPETEAMKRGRHLEAGVAEWFGEECNAEIITPDKMIYSFPGNEIFKVSIDRFYRYNYHSYLGDEKEVLECKTSLIRHTEPKDMPHYWMQVQWELGVTGCERGSLACLFRGFEFESFPIERDDRMIKKMFEAAEKFWEYNVIHGIPPEPINAADAKILYPEHTDGKIYDADYELYEKALQLTSVKERLKELQATEKDLSDELKTAVKDSEEARYNGLKLFTFKAQSTTTLDAKLMKELEPDIYERYKKTSEYRVLRLSPLKEYLNA